MDIVNSGLFIEDERLSAYALSTARLFPPEGRVRSAQSETLIRRAYGSIRRCHDAVQQRYASLPSPPPACEWLLDNWYMVQREYRFIRAELEKAPSLRSCGGLPLVLELCRSMVSSGGGRLDAQRCKLYMDGFQQQTPLQRKELLLLPVFLRFAIFESIAAVCRSMKYAADTSEHAQALSALFGSLRLLSVMDMEKLLRSVDMSDAILCRDPSGDYGRMDSLSRSDYLKKLEKLAQAEGISEQECAERLIEQAQKLNCHVGFLMFSPRNKGAGLYIAFVVLSTLFISLLAALSCGSAAAALLLLLPVSEMVKSLCDFVLLHLVPPRRLPRIDTQNGVPEEGRCICVISVLLSGAESMERYASRLEQLYLSCRSEGRNLSFGLLADLPAADSESCPEDGELLRCGRIAVNSLNRKYGGGFFLFTRSRSFDGSRYTGHERKRGAIMELARLLCDMESSLTVYGEKDTLSGVRYILTLDSDTRVYPGSVGELIGAALHPLSRPRIDPASRIVTAGHAIIHPRMSLELSSANATDFSLIFAGPGGSDPYGALCGELYMDAFESGGFAGKGLIDAHALVECTAHRFPEGCILSHDALEGAYLRGAYMGDVEFSDSFPENALSYYKRLHRWVRGDWQNLPWLFSRGRGLPDIQRWRLFDSLRRSLITPATLLAILAGFLLPAQGTRIAAWAALLALLSNLFLALAQSSTARRERLHLRHYTRLLTGVGGAIVQTFIRLWLLPYDAWVCACAAFTALWRMAVSRKNLLQWQTAEQAAQAGSGVSAHLKAMYFPLLLGAALLLSRTPVIARSAGLMWLLSPFMAAALALPSRKESPLSAADRDYIKRLAGESWKYLSRFSSAEDNFLPPDNFQEQPPVGVAHRSSPTNLGLAMAAAVSVMDMELISPAEAVDYVGRMLGSMERMPRCMGHFYNWYDTRTLLPLSPAYISTVDSGNLYAALCAVRQAMLEMGESNLANHIEKLMEEMDFSPLYDSERGLFHICYDAEKGKGAGGWYDLMASEAMLTSYIAIAKGDVPKKHWRRLSRAQLQKDGYRGLASWTGTMFEYLMPALFLPLCRGSLLYESSRFCVYAQRRRIFAGKPWGISESAFFSLDRALNYRYKAHGCPALALKRGQEQDMVVSPYSTFLALAVEPSAALKNLQRLERFGALGRYGFIEALDFTPGRCRNDSGEQVRCYMAHHVSMSIIAAANAICAGSLVRRFTSEPAMAAHSLLLQEKLPVDGIVIRRDMTQVPEKPERCTARRWQLRGSAEDRGHCCILSNGSYSLICSRQAKSSARLGEVSLYRFPGPRFKLWLQSNGLSLPAKDPELWELSEDSCSFSGTVGGIEHRLELSVSSGDCGELRQLELRPEKSCRAELELSFEPIMAPLKAFTSHPAYGRLGIQAEFLPQAMLLRRLRRGEQSEIWLCIASDRPCSFSSDIAGALRHISQPFCTARLELSLEAGEKSCCRFALCAAFDRVGALEGAERILRAEPSSRANMVGAAASLLGLSPEETGAAMAMVKPLFMPRLRMAAARSRLWPYGVSGDLPIICCDGRALESEKLLRRFCLLKSCGLDADLVFITDEQGEYQQPTVDRLSKLLSAYSLEALIGSPGGVHFVPQQAARLFESRAAVNIGKADKLPPPLEILPSGMPRKHDSTPEYGFGEGCFVFDAGNHLPGRIWQLPLSNGKLGCIAADFGPASMWYENSREMPLTLPPDSIRAVAGSEALTLSYKGKSYSVFASNDGWPCTVSFSPGLCVWEKQLGEKRIKTSLFIAPGSDVRCLLLEGAEGMEYRWAMQPCMSSAQDAASLRCSAENGILSAENPESHIEGLRFLACVSAPARLSCSFSPSAFLAEGTGDKLTVFACGCCGETELRQLCMPETAKSTLAAAVQRWDEILGSFSLESGYGAFDRYMSTWAQYQIIACRLEGRCSLYQSGGAFGFRDQLQDAVNLLLIDSSYAAERIVDCCAHQYVEGDVMHWWHRHKDGDRGVRSRCSDDMLWLCWALCEYVDATGDEELCSLEVNYLSSPLLAKSEKDRYETAHPSEARASVLDHAKASLECCISRGFGQHSLPYFLSGDWNDALNETEGESVWLAWFFVHCAGRFASLLERLGKPGSKRYRELASAVAAAADKCWEGSFYLRGFDGEGRVMGGKGRLDSTVQSWSAFCPEADSIKSRTAVDSALHRLYDRSCGIIKLFETPYSPDEPYIGYISGYGEGFRENGGQYTHGAVWLALACLRQGRQREGWELMQAMLPENSLNSYRAEPFVLAADVYTAPGHVGEAGWSWYTGSAGWYFRTAAQELLGLKMRDGKVYAEPDEDSALRSYTLRFRKRSGELLCIEKREKEIYINGKLYEGGPI